MKTLFTQIKHSRVKNIKDRLGRLNTTHSKFKLLLFDNDYETSYTTYINHARWHRCLRSDGLRVGGNRSARKKPTCLTW